MDPLVCDNEELSRQNMSCRWVFGVVWQVSVDNQITLLLYYYSHKGIFKDGPHSTQSCLPSQCLKCLLIVLLRAWWGDTRESQHRGAVKKYFLFVLKRKIWIRQNLSSLGIHFKFEEIPNVLLFRLKPSLSYDWQPSPHWIQTLIKPLVTARPITISYIKLWYAVWLLCSSSLQEGDGNLITILVLLSTLKMYQTIW